ncbi:hypothetical protein HO133_007118 [Letharia lupina]|uniref:Uncharacterized protein n=1 Tax=Letharia lupina TaxID=560253 RepID=A0A8H6KY68_9LECA|nr:uncharacterized protein HO133_007118 [Letharia lupina]KAF6229004.1 hypothetical protein HO133_007118 [Letharia lupina]
MPSRNYAPKISYNSREINKIHNLLNTHSKALTNHLLDFSPILLIDTIISNFAIKILHNVQPLTYKIYIEITVFPLNKTTILIIRRILFVFNKQSEIKSFGLEDTRILYEHNTILKLYDDIIDIVTTSEDEDDEDEDDADKDDEDKDNEDKDDADKDDEDKDNEDEDEDEDDGIRHEQLLNALEDVYSWVQSESRLAFSERLAFDRNTHIYSVISTAIRYGDHKAVENLIYSEINRRCNLFLRYRYGEDPENAVP